MRYFGSFLLVLLASLHVTGEVWASTGPVLFVPLHDGDAHAVRLEVSVRTSFFFPERALQISSGDKVHFPVTPDEEWKGVDIQPTGKAASTNLNVVLPSGRLTFALQLRRPDAPASACVAQMVIVLPPGQEVPERAPTFNGLCQQNLRADTMGLLFSKMSEERVLPPLVAHYRSAAHALVLRTSSRSLGALGIWFGFEVENVGVHDYPVAGVAIGDGATNKNYVMATMFATPTGRPSEGLRPGQSLRGSVVARDGAVLARRMVVQLLTTPGISPASWSWEEARATPPPRPPPRSVGKLAIGVSGFWGRAQLVAGDGVAEWTPLRGAGVLATYGIQRWLSVEGALTAFDTDHVEATGATVRLAALLHFGDQWVPFARVGLAAAAFRQDQRTRGSMLPTFGFGVQSWIGDDVVATLSASYARESDVLDLAQLSLHLAYAWPL